MVDENNTLKTFTPSVDKGFFDVSPQLTLDALSGILNPFSKQNTFRTPAREEDIRKELKSSHIPEFTDFLLKGGTRGVGTDDLDKTYAKTDNPLIKQAILRGDDFVTGNIIRNNFYGLDLDDRNLISQAYVINARFNPFSSLGKTKKGEEVPENIIAEFNKLKKGKKDFDAGDITQEQYETIKGKSYRNLTENISKEASMSLFKDPRSMESIPFNDPYAGKPKSRKAAIEAGIGPFEQGFSGLRAYDLSPLEELQLKSKYGFSPEVPSYLGPRTGTNYVPTKNQERFRVIPQRSKEGYEGFEPERRIDRLEDFVSMEDSNMLSGPEGVYYNPETKQFLRGEATYGEPPVLQGYKYDPRLIELMQMQRSPAFAEQFKNNGGLTQLAKGGDTMDIKQQTKNVAAQGRYGDSMLLHVNPAEVKGLASAMPITVNPETGQPEAFLPFLAPIAGSLLGGSLLGGALGSTLLGSAVGSGLAQYAATGDLKKGLLAGLTGYGVGTALQTASGAAGASAATTAATDAATTAGTLGDVATQELIQSAGTQAGGEALKTATAAGGTPFSNLKSVFNPAAISPTTAATAPDLLKAGTTVDPTLGTSLGNLATGLADPMAYIPIGIGMGGTGIMESQEAFERMIGETEAEYRRRREEMYRTTPEPILYSAEGGRTGYYEGGRFGNLPDNIGGELPQIYAPARQPYQVNPNFMAGFSPETMYFEPSTISAPASGLRAGAPPVTADTYEGSKGGYGGRQAYIAPQVSIDPYSAYTGEAPEGLKFGKQPRPVFEEPELPDQGLVNPGLPDFGTGPVGLGGRIGIPNIGNLDIQSIIDSLDQYNIPEKEISMSKYMPITGQDLGITPPSLPNIDVNSFSGITPQEPIVNEVITEVTPSFEIPIIPELNRLQTTPNISAIPEINIPTSIELPINPVIPTTENITAPSLNVPVMQEMMPINLGMIPSPISNLESLETQRIGRPSFRDTIRGRAEGGDTLKPIPEDNKGLPNLPEDVRNEMGYKQAGGMTDIQNDPLTKEVTMFILGETDNEQALNDFITKYGSDAFMQLREAVLQSIVPNAQTQGLIKGDGEGGMDDDLRGMIGDKERIAVSQDEFIVPADVVSMLGDGSSDAGSKELYDMMDRVRKEKTGTTKQAPRLANAGGLLPA